MRWGREAWSPELRTAAEAALAAEPDPDLRDRLRLALEGGTDEFA
jgi:hypothetical protein